MTKVLPLNRWAKEIPPAREEFSSEEEDSEDDEDLEDISFPIPRKKKRRKPADKTVVPVARKKKKLKPIPRIPKYNARERQEASAAPSSKSSKKRPPPPPSYPPSRRAKRSRVSEFKSKPNKQ